MEFSAGRPPSFVPKETVILRCRSVRPIKSVRLTGTAGVFEAPLGRSVIGRGSKSTVRIDSNEVSRVHAVLIVSPDRVTIEDQKSATAPPSTACASQASTCSRKEIWCLSARLICAWISSGLAEDDDCNICARSSSFS